MARGWPAVSRQARSRCGSPRTRSAGRDMASSAAPERVSGPRWRNTNRSRSAGGRVNAVPHVIRSLPVQPASSAVSAGSRTVRRPDSQARLSSKLSRTTRSVSAGWAARLAAEASPLTTVTIRSGASRLTRAAIWAARVDLPIPPRPYMTTAVVSGWVRSADQRRRSADRIDREVCWGAAGPDVRAWRAACLGRGAFASGRPSGFRSRFPSGAAAASSDAAFRADGTSCGKIPRVNATWSCRMRTNLATITPLFRSRHTGQAAIPRYIAQWATQRVLLVIAASRSGLVNYRLNRDLSQKVRRLVGGLRACGRTGLTCVSGQIGFSWQLDGFG